MSDSDYASDQFEDDQEFEPEGYSKSLADARPRQPPVRSYHDAEREKAPREMEGESKARPQTRSEAGLRPVNISASSSEPRRLAQKPSASTPAKTSSSSDSLAIESPPTAASSTVATSPESLPPTTPKSVDVDEQTTHRR